MRTNMKALSLAASLLALMIVPASAEVVCNDDGDCWHVKERITYPDGVRVHVHPDDWKWRETDRYRWREHEGPGYWRGGVWVDIK